MAKIKKCPLIRKPCIKDDCEFWHEMIFNRVAPDGTSTPEVVYKCLWKWIPVLLVENAKETRQAAAATESMRNEVSAGAGTILLKALGARGVPALEDK